MTKFFKCKELNLAFVNKSIKIAGWLRTIRNHGNVIFADIYDYNAYVQCVVEKSNEELSSIINKLNLESVVEIEGIVQQRSFETINKKIITGEIEIIVTKITVLNEAKILPFALHQENISEELQMNYRFLYLRTEKMQNILKTRTEIIDFCRQFMKKEDFLEVQTPLLANSSDEGARDYVVPSRLNPGQFYALPQAPQQFKQLLMASGVEKYFQVAPCFRDEDPRADRLVGEFYQLDFEHAFATEETILNIIEKLLLSLFNHFKPNEVPQNKITKLTYKEAIETYGSDKPDLRNKIKLFKLSENEAPNMFKQQMAENKNFQVVALGANVENMTSGYYNKLLDLIKQHKGKGLAYCTQKNGEWSGPLSKMLSLETLEKVAKNAAISINTCFLIASENAFELGAVLRNELGKDSINENEYQFCFVTDFPMFEEKDGKIEFMHNPFSMPKTFEGDPLEIISMQYDAVCNGYEILSGAVRNHKIENIQKIFKFTQQEISLEQLIQNFPVFKSFAYGIPPHAGAAFGLDRIVMLLTKQKNVRDIVAFPLNQHGKNLLMNSPSSIDEKLKKELKIKILD